MSDTLLVATRKGLFTLKRAEHAVPRWQITSTDFLGDNVSMVLTDSRDGWRYAALEHGHFGCKMHRSPGPDAPWEECASPTYPPKPEGIVDTDGWGKPIPWSTIKIWALEAGGADQPGLLWCGTIPGGLFCSRDRGESWELNRPLWDEPKRQKWFGGGAELPGIHSVVVDPRNSNIVRLGISCGGVWMTEDGGKSWFNHGHGLRADFMPPEQQFDPNIQDVHRLAQCRSHPDQQWIQHHNGIFVSSNNGKTWREAADVPFSSFGFVVAAHPLDPMTAWFVPALSDQKRVTQGQIVVTRTCDGGRTYEMLTEGLPEENAFDITLRHCLDVDSRGERLAFGTTTGNLWISENGGESWTSVTHHLPPIYAVRFAG
jgi:hypothetical protein